MSLWKKTRFPSSPPWKRELSPWDLLKYDSRHVLNHCPPPRLAQGGDGGWFPKVNIWRTNGNFCLLCPISQNQLQVICKGMLFSPLGSLYTVQFRKTSKLQLVCCPHKLGEDCRNINSFGGGILPQQENKAGGYPQQYFESAFTALLLLPLAFSQNWWG